jgi:tetratricopeptide (TPR) repeat protein
MNIKINAFLLSILISKIALFSGWCANEQPSKLDTQNDIRTGRRLSLREAKALESLVKTNAEDLSARTKLLGYYFGRSQSAQDNEARQKHVLWIIKNRPESEIAGLPYCGADAILDKDSYEQGKKLWLEQTKAHPKNATIFGHAAKFVLTYDTQLAEELLKQGQKIDPGKIEFSEQLGRLYGLQPGKDAALKSLAEYEKAQEADPSETSRFYRLDSLAKAAYKVSAFEKASRYANELLDSASKYPQDWNYGNAIHHGNNVLGRIALTQGDIPKAKDYLLKAGKTSDSPQLASFGPNMSLAKDLLEKGEKDIVVQYLELCRNFWSMGKANLDEWIKQIKAGETPNFGPNLIY